jgi:hypothetical protein
MKLLALILTIIISEIIMSQNFDFEQHLYQSYEIYKEKSITDRRFKHADILPLIEKLKHQPGFTVKKVGESVEGRDLNLVSIGSGKTKIFLWSQMHGDESTATAALFDIFNFLSDSSNKQFYDYLFGIVSLYFLPMVNPDGAERFKRRNAYDIDLNRDASRLQCPEAIVLKNVFDSLKAEFGFNLHDQSIRYSVGNSFRTASISFLAPAFNYAKDVNNVRERSVQVIGNLYQALSQFIPGHIAKYSDEYEPRAFGDNFQKWGTSTILIESGGWKDDPEKQFLRKVNFIAILSAIKTIADESYTTTSDEIYNSIPLNDKFIFDLILRNLQIENGKEKIKIDIGINLDEIGDKDGKTFHFKSQVADLGDLSTFFGYTDLNLDGYKIQKAETYKDKIFKLGELNNIDLYDIYSKGCTNIIVDKLPDGKFSDLPINLALSNKIDTTINIDEPANFVLKKNGKVEYVVINGFLQKVEKNRKFDGNGIIIR